MAVMSEGQTDIIASITASLLRQTVTMYDKTFKTDINA